MKSFDIEDIKSFMNELFQNEKYDSFYLYEIRLKTNLDYYISGKLNKDFYEEDDKPEAMYDYIVWADIKHTVYELIKGKRLPVSFKAVLMFNRENITRLIEMNNLPIRPEDVNNLSINIYFENSRLTVTAGSSVRVFTMDKTLEHLWDDTIEKYYI